MATTGNMGKFLVGCVAWCCDVLFCLALPVCVSACQFICLPFCRFFLFRWICLLPSSLVRKSLFMFMELEMQWWNYNTPDLAVARHSKFNSLFCNLSPVDQRRVRGTKLWLQSLGIMALVSRRVRNSGSFRCHRMSSTRPGYRFPARVVGPFHSLSPSVTMEKMKI